MTMIKIMHKTIFIHTRWQIKNLSLKYEQIQCILKAYSTLLMNMSWSEHLKMTMRTYHWWRPPWNRPHRSQYPPPSLSDPHPPDKSPYAGGNLPPPAVRTYWIQTWTNVHTLKKIKECTLYRDIHRPLDQSQLNLIISSKKITSSGKILYVTQFCWTRNWKWEWITIFEIPWYLQSTAAEWSFPAATLVMMYRVNGFTVLNVYLHGMS